MSFHPLWAGLSFQSQRRLMAMALAYKGFHPLWAGLSFQREVARTAPDLVRRVGVSIPFGRVSVFKGRIGNTFLNSIVSRSFHPLWAGLSFQSDKIETIPAVIMNRGLVSIPFGRVSVFKAK